MISYFFDIKKSNKLAELEEYIVVYDDAIILRVVLNDTSRYKLMTPTAMENDYSHSPYRNKSVLDKAFDCASKRFDHYSQLFKEKDCEGREFFITDLEFDYISDVYRFSEALIAEIRKNDVI